MMLQEKVDTIILDVDGTLSEEVSWLKLTHGLGANSEKHSDIFEKFKKGQLSYPEAKKKLIKLWQDTKHANKDYMIKMFHSWKLKEDVAETIDYLRRNYRVCLISGAVDLYVQTVAEKLKVKDWYANTQLIWNIGNELVDFDYHADQAQKKLEQFEDFVTKNQLKKSRCAVVGDGDSDLILFNKLPYGIAVNVNPYPELESLAFKTIKNLWELRNIF